MQNPAATIYCPNYSCQAPNPESNKFCHKCRTLLPKRYLWAVGAGLEKSKLGDILGDRYLLKGKRILLDTKPGLLPDMTEDLPEEIISYLRLFPHRLHVPQVYGRLMLGPDATIWLLEQAAIYPDWTEAPAPKAGQLMPALADEWEKAPALRQLNWLWQIAGLWLPFRHEEAASTLLALELLRVEGAILRVLELKIEPKVESEPPRLSQLGEVWSKLIPKAQPLIVPFLKKLCQQLVGGEVQASDQLVALLDRAGRLCGDRQIRTYSIGTATDQGPSRTRNEDACYPSSQTTSSSGPGIESLAIVCDGIGGHKGGNIASNRAIETVKTYIQQRYKQIDGNEDSETLSIHLEGATAAANDAISQQNDAEQNQGRDRMGTTLVISLAHAHEIYLTHVGDSRAYWITNTGCRQVTLDDDLASREVRLGYALYRDALQQAASGSLVQALGMAPSSHLHPTIQRFIIDEDSIFLLCSDGLSDNDRVEEHWETAIMPILKGELSLEKAVNLLIDIGNYHNGHDNVTVALVHCGVKANPEATVSAEALVAELEDVPPPLDDSEAGMDEDTKSPDIPAQSNTGAPTKIAPKPKSSPIPLPILLAIITSLGLIIAGLAYWRVQEGKNPALEPQEPAPSTSPSPSRSSSPSPQPTPETEEKPSSESSESGDTQPVTNPEPTPEPDQ